MNSVLSPDFRIPGDLLTFVNVNSNTINVRIVFLYKKAVVWSKTRSSKEMNGLGKGLVIRAPTVNGSLY